MIEEQQAQAEQPKAKTPHTIEQLNECYRKANDADKEQFAKMRANILLEAGNHWNRKGSDERLFNQIRNSQNVPESQKLKLTKNHMQKISKTYKNSILEKMPGVTITPHNELEMQDKKSAEINEAVWKDMRERYNLHAHKRDSVANYVTIGEVCTFLYFDPNSGPTKGFEQLVDEQGMPQFDESGSPIPDPTRPVMSGGFVFKNIPAYNLLRAPGAKTMKGSPYLIIREMVAVKDLEGTYGQDPAKLSYIKASGDEQFYVFDSNKKNYEEAKDEILVRYHFYRPCKQYPNGYFYICVKGGILESGEIPFGLFPLVWQGFDMHADNPRASSILEVAKPYQAEINRASSQMAMHQITVGDDKILYQGGTKLESGALLPGVRGIKYQGVAPITLPGRDGSQFLPYIDSQIQEMYSACMLEEMIADKPVGVQDPYALLFQSASQQKAFKDYVDKIEEWEKELCLLALEMAKKYYDDDTFIKIVGKSEYVNIAEFRNTLPNSFTIKAEAQSEAIDTRLGKQIALNQILQYVGSQLQPKHIGLIMKEMPYLNNKSLFKYMTSDYDNVENDMLAIERGQTPDISPYADNQTYVDAFTNRMKQPDFSMLAQPIQQIYMEVLMQHEDEIKRKEAALQQAKDGFIPTGGALITCSMHVADPSKDSGTRQVRVPYEALMDLITKLEAQGSSLDALEQMNPGAVADMNPPQAPPPQQGMMPPQQ